MKILASTVLLLAGCTVQPHDGLSDGITKLGKTIHVLDEQSKGQSAALREAVAMITELCAASPHACVKTMDKHKKAMDAALDRVIQAKDKE